MKASAAMPLQVTFQAAGLREGLGWRLLRCLVKQPISPLEGLNQGAEQRQDGPYYVVPPVDKDDICQLMLGKHRMNMIELRSVTHMKQLDA